MEFTLTAESEAIQHAKGIAFRDLHHRDTPFVLANAWDGGTARLLTHAGFAALGTTSAGLSFSLARPDGANAVDRTRTLENARQIVASTSLPVSADLESGFGETTEEIEETFRLAAEVGLVGGSIEDATGAPSAPIRPLDEAADRVRHAVRAASQLPFPFTVTARAENFLYGDPDLADTIGRLQAYALAGADVLYAPGLPDLDSIRRVCAEVPKPVNVLVGGQSPPSVAELGRLGVSRVSLGSLLARAALFTVLTTAREIQEHGTFSFATNAIPYAEANAFMSAQGSPS